MLLPRGPLRGGATAYTKHYNAEHFHIIKTHYMTLQDRIELMVIVGNGGQTLQWLVVHAQRGRLVDYSTKVRASRNHHWLRGKYDSLHYKNMLN